MEKDIESNKKSSNIIDIYDYREKINKKELDYSDMFQLDPKVNFND